MKLVIDHDTGAYMDVPSGGVVCDPGVLVVSPLGRIGACADLVVCEVLCSGDWKDYGLIEQGSKVLALDPEDRMELGAGSLKEVFVMKSDVDLIVSVYEARDGLARDGLGESVEKDRIEAIVELEKENTTLRDKLSSKNTKKPKPKIRPAQKGVCTLHRKAGVTNWIKLSCSCESSRIFPPSMCDAEIPSTRKETTLWIVESPYECERCGLQITHAEEEKPKAVYNEALDGFVIREDGLMEMKTPV